MSLSTLVLALVTVSSCKRAHVSLPPGPPAVLDRSPNATLPTTTAPIEARMQGGLAGGYHWTVRVWDDGTVGFSGERCHGTHRAMLPRSRVRELEDALARIELIDSDDEVCPDAFQYFVRVGERSDLRDECAKHTAAIDNALELMRTAIGTGPCDPAVLTFPRR